MKTGWEQASSWFHVVFLLGLGVRMAVGTRRVGPTRPTDGKEKTNFEC